MPPPEDMAGEDASLDDAVQAIVGVMRKEAPVSDRRENRTDRDTIERDESTDLEESEREEREQEATERKGSAEGEDVPDDGAEETFIELPADSEDGEPERVALTEAIEAVKQLRAMNGEIGTAIIKAEEEAFQKQDQITQRLASTLDEVTRQARVSLEAMWALAPQPPDQIMLDRNSGYYDPEGYHLAKLNHDRFWAQVRNVEAKLDSAQKGRAAVDDHGDKDMIHRETERAARFIPAFKDPAQREARKAEILNVLGQKYGITKQELDEIVDHKAWRIMNDLTDRLAVQKKAPEVRKAVEEKAAKLVKGRLPVNRDASGRYASEARKQLRETGSEDAFVNYLLKSSAKTKR